MLICRQSLSSVLVTLVIFAGGCDKGTSPVTPSASGTGGSSGAAASTSTPPAAAQTQPTGQPAPSPGAAARFHGLQAPVPSHWKWTPVTKPMRSANYMITDGGQTAELVIFFLGERAGGSTAENIERWIGQVQSPDGSPVEPKVETSEVGGMGVTVVELAGTYLGMGTTPPLPDALFLTAIVEVPSGDKIFVRLVGPREIVEANREHYRNMIEGITPE